MIFFLFFILFVLSVQVTYIKLQYLLQNFDIIDRIVKCRIASTRCLLRVPKKILRVKERGDSDRAIWGASQLMRSESVYVRGMNKWVREFEAHSVCGLRDRNKREGADILSAREIRYNSGKVLRDYARCK